ncbi:MAG: hypothetical protein WBG01_07460, partial [Bacteroidota bacterium]
DPEFRGFYEQTTDVLPPFFEDRVRKALGHMWHWLPPGAMRHDPNAYLKAPAAADRVKQEQGNKETPTEYRTIIAGASL